MTRIHLDLTEIQKHIEALREIKSRVYTLNEKAVRAAIKETGLWVGGYYGPLHQLTNERVLHAIVSPGLYIPLGKVYGPHPWHPEKRAVWELSVSGTPGASLYGGIESNLYQLHFKMVEKQEKSKRVQ